MGNWSQAQVDPTALLHNLQRVREISPNRAILAMVKANAYGHGLVQTARILHSAEALGVARLEEALELRQAGIKNRIVLMEGFLFEHELADIVQWQLETIIHHTFQIALLEKYSNSKIKTWVKLNTGMNRLGLSEQQFAHSLQRLRGCSDIQCILTHFSDADVITKPKTCQQIADFTKCQASFSHNYPLSYANSAAILGCPSAHADWVRPGLMLYGISPFADSIGADFNLKPAMQLVAKLIAINLVRKNQTLGYTSRFTCPEDMLVGVVSIGYADGYPSVVPDGMPVLLHNRQAQVIGKVSMDMATIDLRGHPQAKIGDEVVLWGKDLPIEIIASKLGIIPYELLTSVGTRVSRIYLQAEEKLLVC